MYEMKKKAIGIGIIALFVALAVSGCMQTKEKNQQPPTNHPDNQHQQPPQDNNTNHNQQPPRNSSSNDSNQYSIEQATSDRAQLDTLSFDGLGFLTGNLCSDSFLPPGKLADFFGFQYLRDTTQAGKGHSTDFVTNCANNVLYILTTDQKAQMTALATIQASEVNDYAIMRYPLMQSFRRLLTGDIPAGTTGLNKNAVMAYSESLYELDANISLQRAQLFSSILQSLSTSQKEYLDTMVTEGFSGWPALPDQVDKKNLSHDEDVLVMTYASEMFGWYAGNVEADTYFCPERQADYFGGFYIKDAPAIGTPGYTINETITGEKGEAFLATLDTTQKPVITSLVDIQRLELSQIVETRRTIATELRKALTGGTLDQEKVRTLGRQYGALDGEISYYYATAFSTVGKTITSTQQATLSQIRDLENCPCEDGKIYLFSEKINQPDIDNTNFLFE